MGLLQGEGMATRFFNRMGASRLARTICSEAGFEGYLYTMGAAEGMDTEAFAHARLILIWGSNTLTSNLHLWPFVQAARKAGGTRDRHRPGQHAYGAGRRRVDRHPPRHRRRAGAGHDARHYRRGAARRRLRGALHVGFAQLAERVAEWTPDRAAAITGVPAERIAALAREYATTQPAAIRINYGLQRHYGGGMAVRTITCLPALVGAWRYHGGGIQLSTSGLFRHLEKDGLYRP